MCFEAEEIARKSNSYGAKQMGTYVLSRGKFFQTPKKHPTKNHTTPETPQTKPKHKNTTHPQQQA